MLTDLGKRTSDVVLELALFGAGFEPQGDVVAAGNLRTVATTLGAAANRVVSKSARFDAAIIVDGEPMHLKVRNGKADMYYGEYEAPDVVFSTSYADLLAATEGDLDLEIFVGQRSTLDVHTAGKDIEFLDLMNSISVLLRER